MKTRSITCVLETTTRKRRGELWSFLQMYSKALGFEDC